MAGVPAPRALLATKDRPEPMQIVLHIGAHKTASTYLQDRLAAHRDALARAGVALATPPDIRGRIETARARLGPLRLVAGRSRRLLVRAVAETVADAAAAGAARLLLSEENVLGPMDPLLDDAPFYKRAGDRLADLMAVLAGHDVTLALAVRNYGSFYSSVWGFRIREGYVPFGADLKARLLARSGEWPDLVARLAGAAPGVPLTIWKYEDHGALEARLLRCLTGTEIDIPPAGYHPLRGPSRKAVRRLEALAADGPVTPEIVARVLKVQSTAKGLPRYDPWTDDERRALTRRYRADVETIRAMPEVMPLVP